MRVFYFLFLIQLNILVRIADQREVAFELLARDDDRGAVVVGVETERGAVEQVAIEEQMHVVLLVVDQSEGRHRTGQQA